MLQHVNVKFYLNESGNLDQSEVLNVFHEWIQQDKLDDLLIDVADYRHVPNGPGIILVAHNAFYSLDNAQGRLGLLYNRRTAVEGDAHAVLVQALKAASDFAVQLAGDPRFKGAMTIDPRTLQISVNDRHFASNTDETFAALKPVMEAALKEVWGDRTYAFERAADARSRFGVEVTADAALAL